MACDQTQHRPPKLSYRNCPIKTALSTDDQSIEFRQLRLRKSDPLQVDNSLGSLGSGSPHHHAGTSVWSETNIKMSELRFPISILAGAFSWGR